MAGDVVTRGQVAAGVGIGAMFLVGSTPGCPPLAALLMGLVAAVVMYGQGDE